VETEGIARSVLWTISQLVLSSWLKKAMLQLWLSRQIYKASPWLLFFRLTVRTAGGCPVNSNLLAKILEHENSRIFFNSEHWLSFPPPIFRKFSKCSKSHSLSAVAIYLGSSNRRSGSPR
jgi:hypothetical protein